MSAKPENELVLHKFVDLRKNYILKEEVLRDPFKKIINKSLIRLFLQELSKFIDIDKIDINQNFMIDILFYSVNKYIQNEEQFFAYFNFFIQYLPHLIQNSLFIKAIKWNNNNEFSFYFSDKITTKLKPFDSSDAIKHKKLQKQISSQYKNLRCVTSNCIAEINTKTMNFECNINISQFISFYSRFFDVVDDHSIKIEFKFLFEYDPTDKQYHNRFLNDKQICNHMLLKFSRINLKDLSDECSIVFDLDLSSGKIIFNAEKSFQINKFMVKELNYIFNVWINSMIYPGFKESCRFIIYDSSKKTIINNSFFIQLIYQDKVERQFMLHQKSNCMFLMNPVVFDNIQFDSIDRLFDSAIMDRCNLEYMKKKKCYLHSREVEYELNNNFSSNKGVLFLDREQKIPKNDFFRRWYELNNFHDYQCKCNLSPGVNNLRKTTLLSTIASSSSSLLNTSNSDDNLKESVSDFFSNLYINDMCSLQSIDFGLSTSTKSDTKEIFLEEKEIDVILFFNENLPSNGGTITNGNFNFPTIRFIENRKYNIILNTEFIAPSIKGNLHLTQFYIYSINSVTSRQKVLFSRPLLSLSKDKYIFTPSEKLKEESIFYGSLEEFQSPWGQCDIISKEQFAKVSIGYSLFLDEKYVPIEVKQRRLDQRIDNRIANNLNALKFTYDDDIVLPFPSSSSSEPKKQYIVFMIEPYYDDKPDDGLLQKIERNLIYTNPYAANKHEKNFIIKYYIFDRFENIADRKHPEYQEIPESLDLDYMKYDYYFLFVYHRNIIKTLPAMIPFSLDLNRDDKEGESICRMNVQFFKDITIKGAFYLPSKVKSTTIKKICVSAITNYTIKNELMQLNL